MRKKEFSAPYACEVFQAAAQLEKRFGGKMSLKKTESHEKWDSVVVEVTEEPPATEGTKWCPWNPLQNFFLGVRRYIPIVK